jgi:hypothetical protein
MAQLFRAVVSLGSVVTKSVVLGEKEIHQKASEGDENAVRQLLAAKRFTANCLYVLDQPLLPRPIADMMVDTMTMMIMMAIGHALRGRHCTMQRITDVMRWFGYFSSTRPTPTFRQRLTRSLRTFVSRLCISPLAMDTLIS